MSDTPRTDKEQFNEEGEDAFLVVYASFARELERELNEQVLCNGKGAERESDLLGKVERLERKIACLREAAMWCLPLTHGQASATPHVKIKAYSLGALLQLCNSEPSA